MDQAALEVLFPQSPSGWVTCYQYLTICVYVCTSMCVDVHVSERRCPERLEAGDPPEFGGTVTHKLLDVGAGNQIQDLWKSSKRS